MKNFICYPPAETKLPISAFLAAIWPQSMNFDKALCRFLSSDKCILANSGRSLLYKLLSVRNSFQADCNEVLVPGYTCYSVAAAVARAGLVIRPYDLEPDTLGPDMDALRKLASSRTLAIIVQHLFGIPTPLNEVREVAHSMGAILIEDAAQALGGSLDGRLLGTDGDFGLFSFGRGKPLPLGSGGALIGSDPKMLEFMRLNTRSAGIMQFTVSAASQVASKPCIYGIAEKLPLGLGETVFEPEFEYSSMGSLMAKLGSQGMEYLSALNMHRARIAGIYKQKLQERFSIALPVNARPVYPRYPLLIGPGPIPEDLRSLGVRRMYPKAIADEESISPFLAENSPATPGATQIAHNLATLPTHKGISEQLASQIASMVNRCYP